MVPQSFVRVLPKIDVFRLKMRICVMDVKAAINVLTVTNATFLKMRELQMVRAVGVTRANEPPINLPSHGRLQVAASPEASVTTDIESDLTAQQLTIEDIEELHIDSVRLSPAF